MPLRCVAIRRLAAALVFSSSLGAPLAAQGAANRTWDDPATLALVARAIGRRTAQLADTGLTDYRALAHGYLTFLAQLGEGFPDPPQVVRADELAVEVYWRAPNQSKQRIVGRRDTLVLPTDIAYHRDHLVIVQNNFPAIIRLGDGDEVRDVPHPLSVAGQGAYAYATADSLSIRVGGRTWDVVAVEVRPRDDRLPRVVGSLYLDRETASVVRLALTFTRAALIDPALEDVSVVLDNGLVDARFWLPRRQEIEIRRTGTWLEFPARGLIRGEWDLCCIEANRGVAPEVFVGPEISIAPPAALAAYPFVGTLADSRGARVRAAGPGRQGDAVLARAGALVRRDALGRKVGIRLAASGVSDFVRVTRVQGLALGGGVVVPVAGVGDLRVAGGYGLDDRLWKHRISLTRAIRTARLTIAAFDEYRDAGTVPEMSGAGNSLAAQEFGADFTDEYRAAGLSLALAGAGEWRWSVGIEQLRESPLAVHARPARGRYRPALPADAIAATRAELRLGKSVARDDGARLALEASVAARWTHTGLVRTVSSDPHAPRDSIEAAYLQALLLGELTRPVRLGTVALRGIAASAITNRVARQDEVRLGGSVTAPGYAARSFAAPVAAMVRAEWQVPVASFALPLGRFGRTASAVRAAPFVSGAWRGGVDAGVPSRAVSFGIGLMALHDLLRLDLARGVDRGGHWAVYLDVDRRLWPIL